jgi:hypothetical protein
MAQLPQFPWDIEEHNQSSYIVRDGNRQALADVYFESEPGERQRLADSGRGPTDRGTAKQGYDCIKHTQYCLHAQRGLRHIHAAQLQPARLHVSERSRKMDH